MTRWLGTMLAGLGLVVLAGCGGGAGGSTAISTTNVCAPGAWTTTGQPFFETYCNGCHSFTSDTAIQFQASQISSAIQSGRMPPWSAGTPSAAERDAIIQWLGCGAPQ